VTSVILRKFAELNLVAAVPVGVTRLETARQSRDVQPVWAAYVS